MVTECIDAGRTLVGLWEQGEKKKSKRWPDRQERVRERQRVRDHSPLLCEEEYIQ